MSDTNDKKPESVNTTAAPSTKQQQGGKKTQGNAVAKVSQAEIQKSINRKKWVDRIAMILLTSALIVYFIVLIFSMVSNANATMVEKTDDEQEMETPAMYLEFITDSSSTNLDCTIDYSTSSGASIKGRFLGTTFTPDDSNTEGWSIMTLEKFNYTGLIVTPPEGDMLKVERTITNLVETDCTVSNLTVYVNFYHVGQYDQYADEEQDLVDAIAYDAFDSKIGFETDYDLEWYTVSDELEFAKKPQELDGIDGAYDYYEMSLSGVYPLSGSQGDTVCKTGFACYRKHTQYVYEDSTTFYDVVAAVGGMYTSLASILAWFLVKFLWGYDFKIYKWPGYAPYAPKNANKEGEEKDEEGGEEDAGLDI